MIVRVGDSKLDRGQEALDGQDVWRLSVVALVTPLRLADVLDRLNVFEESVGVLGLRQRRLDTSVGQALDLRAGARALSDSRPLRRMPGQKGSQLCERLLIARLLWPCNTDS